MLCNGLNSYDEVVQAVELYQEAYADTSITYSDDEATFKMLVLESPEKTWSFVTSYSAELLMR